VTFLGCLFTPTASAVTWEKTYGEVLQHDFEGGNAVQQTSDGGYIIAGTTKRTPDSNRDAFLIKTNASGNEQWTRTYGGSDFDRASSAQQTADGGYIIVGDTFSFYVGDRNRDVYLVKTDASGDEQWSKTFGGSLDAKGNDVQQTTDGGYIIVGYKQFLNYESAVYLIKTDGSGNEQWSKDFGRYIYGKAHGSSVQQTIDGGYIIVGETMPGGASQVYLIKTDANGNEQWSKTFGGSETDRGYSVQQTTDGGYIITGFTDSFGAGAYDVYLIKTDTNGNEQWSKTFGGSNKDKGIEVQQTSDGYIISGGTSSFREEGGNEIYLIKTDQMGNEQWSRTFSGYRRTSGGSLDQASDGGYIIAGGTSPFNDRGSEVYLINNRR